MTIKTGPIIFSTPMVQAILDGRKTMTRRVIKDKDIINAWDCESDGTPIAYLEPETGDHYPSTYPAKYQPGDILWVRETWSIQEDLPYDNYVYRTNYGTTKDDSFPPSMFKWRPSIHMPKAAARIFLRVTNVRVERVQDIKPHDAWLEGCRFGNSFAWEDHIPDLQQMCRDNLFIQLWNSINSKRGYGWASNPWIWVYTFERTDKPEGWCTT